MTGKSRAVGPYGENRTSVRMSVFQKVPGSVCGPLAICEEAAQCKIRSQIQSNNEAGRTLKTERIYRDMISNEVEISDS